MMKAKIWSFLSQILFYHDESANLIKPFFENLNNENLNNNKHILQKFPYEQLKTLYKNGIINDENSSSLGLTNQQSNNDNIEEIISGDKIKELEKLIQDKDIQTFNTIIKSFNEVKWMKIPLIQYCIIKKAIKCFKFLLINGFDDPNKLMEEANPNPFMKFKSQHLYEWNCMTTAIYLGNKEIVKILEDKGIEKGKNPVNIEGAILSYQNSIAKRIIEEMEEQNEDIQNILNQALLASSRNNNIKGAELIISKGVNLNAKDINYHIIKTFFLFKTILTK